MGTTAGYVNTLASTVRECRTQLGLSQRELASIIGCAPTLIAHIEAGRKLPSPPLARNMDKERHGTIPRGERHYKAKLRTDDVAAIRAHRGFLPGAHLAGLFGVSATQITYIQKRKSWAHI